MTKKPFHYYAIQKRVTRELWDNLSSRERSLISNDAEHTTDAFKRFSANVENETDKRFVNPDYPLNQAYTFSYAYWNDRVSP